MGRHREFEASKAERNKEPITFKIGKEEFECIPILPAVAMGAFDADGSVNGVGRILDFIRTVLVERDVRRFDNAIISKRNIIEQETLVEIFNWLVEEYLGRPTQEP